MSTEEPQTTEAATESKPDPYASGDIVARAGRYYRNTRYAMFVLLVAMGGWFLYDGYVKYPRHNAILADLDTQQKKAMAEGNQAEQARIATEKKKYEFHNDSALLLQRMLGIGLPPLGVLTLWWSLHRSRGEYRLSGTKLSVPGHPTIDLSDIQGDRINDDLWDRKGIIWLPYRTSDGKEGEIVLDDFIYDRPPTDAIYDRIADRFGLNEDEEDEEDEDDEESKESEADEQKTE